MKTKFLKYGVLLPALVASVFTLKAQTRVIADNAERYNNSDVTHPRRIRKDQGNRSNRFIRTTRTSSTW